MPKKIKKTSRGKRILILVLSILILAIAGTGVFVWQSLGATGNGSTTIDFEIEEGETFDSVLSNLKEEGLISSVQIVDLYAKLTSHDQYFAGTFELNDGMSVSELLETIADETKVLRESVTLTIPEGTWAKEIAASISELFPQYTQSDILAQWNDLDYLSELAADYSFLNLEDLSNSEYNVALEGYLFPETYFLDMNSDLDTITRTLLDQFGKIYEEHQSEFESSEYSVHELVTLASIVQFEAGSVKDMPTIAGVFYNRLRDQMNLESSVTVCYALYDEFDDPKDCETRTDIESPYNTYLNSGLPIGPILNPGEDALVSVLEPETSDYYFFAADINGDGTVHYSKTYEEHLAICEELGLILN